MQGQRRRSAALAAVSAAAALCWLMPGAASAAPERGHSPTVVRPAVATSGHLNVSGQAQEQTNWCWAATGNSIAAFYGYGQYSQNQFCNLAFGNALNASCPNNQATLANDQQAFRTIGISAGTYVTGTISLSAIANQIAAGHPVMARIQWAAGGGHMEVLTGYDSSAGTVDYYDPWPSDSRYNTSTYAWYQSNSQFSWTHTLYGIGA